MVEATAVIKVNWRVSAVFQFNAFHYFVPQGGGRFSSASRKDSSPLVRSVVFLNEVTDVYFHSASHLW